MQEQDASLLLLGVLMLPQFHRLRPQEEAKRADKVDAAVAKAREQQVKAEQRLAGLAAREDELQQGILGGLAARRSAQSRIAELNEKAGWHHRTTLLPWPRR